MKPSPGATGFTLRPEHSSRKGLGVGDLPVDESRARSACSMLGLAHARQHRGYRGGDAHGHFLVACSVPINKGWFIQGLPRFADAQGSRKLSAGEHGSVRPLCLLKIESVLLL